MVVAEVEQEPGGVLLHLLVGGAEVPAEDEDGLGPGLGQEPPLGVAEGLPPAVGVEGRPPLDGGNGAPEGDGDGLPRGPAGPQVGGFGEGAVGRRAGVGHGTPGR